MSLTFKKDTHQYFVGDVEKISISKIISFYLGNDYYCDWCKTNSSNCKCSNNCYKCDNVRAACVKGSAVHKVAELYFKNINCENVVEKIKSTIKKNPIFTENILSHCDNLLNFLEVKFKNNKEYISEQRYYTDIVAGTPDLIFKSNLELYSIIDFKTFKTMTKQVQEKTELQLTAYYWILRKNGFKLSNTQFIVLIQENKVETISVEITKEKLHE